MVGVGVGLVGLHRSLCQNTSGAVDGGLGLREWARCLVLVPKGGRRGCGGKSRRMRDSKVSGHTLLWALSLDWRLSLVMVHLTSAARGVACDAGGVRCCRGPDRQKRRGPSGGRFGRGTLSRSRCLSRGGCAEALGQLSPVSLGSARARGPGFTAQARKRRPTWSARSRLLSVSR